VNLAGSGAELPPANTRIDQRGIGIVTAKKPVSPSAAMLLAESRRWTRFLTDDTTTVSWQYQGEMVDLPVCDESYGGLGFLVPPGVDLEVGQEIVVQYRNAPMRGIVRYVIAHDGDIRRAGLEWVMFQCEANV
jgi:hypothetical protein